MTCYTETEARQNFKSDVRVCTCMYVMYVMYVCMYVCMYVRMYVCIFFNMVLLLAPLQR